MMRMAKQKSDIAGDLELAAGNGLVDRRSFLNRAGSAAGLLGAGLAGVAASSAQADPLKVEDWTKAPGSYFTAYGQPSKFESGVGRGPIAEHSAMYVSGPGSIRSPLQFLEGVSAQTLGLKGDEQITIHGLGASLKPRQDMEMAVKFAVMLVDTGRLSAEEAPMHPRRNLLLRTIDGIHELELDVARFDGLGLGGAEGGGLRRGQHRDLGRGQGRDLVGRQAHD